jgi:hypothetical protein
MKNWYQSKTVWLGLLTLTISILTYLQSDELISRYPDIVAALGTSIGIMTILLRYVSEKPMALTRKVQWQKRKSGLRKQ